MKTHFSRILFYGIWVMVKGWGRCSTVHFNFITNNNLVLTSKGSWHCQLSWKKISNKLLIIIINVLIFKLYYLTNAVGNLSGSWTKHDEERNTWEEKMDLSGIRSSALLVYGFFCEGGGVRSPLRFPLDPSPSKLAYTQTIPTYLNKPVVNLTCRCFPTGSSRRWRWTYSLWKTCSKLWAEGQEVWPWGEGTDMYLAKFALFVIQENQFLYWENRVILNK